MIRIIPAFNWFATSMLAVSFFYTSPSQAELTVRHYDSWSTLAGQIDFSDATLVFEGIDTGPIQYWNGDRYYLWSPLMNQAHNFGVEWSGYIRIAEAGQYGFGTISDDGSEVWLDGELIVANNELQWYDWEDNISEGNTSGETFPPLHLNSGYHALTIRFYEEYSFAGIEFWWLKPGSGSSDIPHYGTNFHGVAPTANPNTNWEIVPADVFTSLLPSELGDFDHDSDVDGYDFLDWQRGESPNPWSAEDLSAWQATYGQISPLATLAVPEPNSLLLLVLALPVVIARRRTTAWTL